MVSIISIIGAAISFFDQSWGKSTKIGFRVAAGVTTAIAAGLYWWLIWKKYPITFGGQLLLALILAGIILLPMIAQALIGWLRSSSLKRVKKK